MKKFLLLVGCIFFLLLVAIVTVPFFVNVDHYRPMIVAEANKQLNGRLELGKLSLSLWGAVKVKAESIKVTVNGFPKPLLNTEKFLLEIPFSSVLIGRPQVIAVLDTPEIEVVKNAQGEMNVMKLVKAPAVGAAPAPAPTAPAKSVTTPPAPSPVTTAGKAPESAEKPKVPALIAGASLGVSIKKGSLIYVDNTTHAKYAVEGLDFEARHLGFAGTMEIQFNAPVKGAAPEMKFDGDLSGSMAVTPVLAGGELRSAKGNISFDATKLAVEMPGGIFRKTNSMPLLMKANFDGNEKSFTLKGLEFRFDDYKIFGKGALQMVPSLHARFEVSTDPMRLDRIQAFVPMVADYGLKGTANLSVNLETNGTVHKVNGDFRLNDGEFMMKGMLKEPFHYTVQAGFTENSLLLQRALLTAPDSEIQLQGNITNFLAPRFAFTMNGKSFNVDKALILPPPAAKKTAALFVPEAEAATTPVVQDTPNPMLALAANPIMMKASGTFTGQIGRLTAYKANIESISLKAQLANMVLRLQEASLRAFGGSVHTTGDFDLKSTGLAYKTQGTVKGISAQAACENYMPKYKNTLDGKVDANWNLTGQVYPQSKAMHSMNGTAKFQAQDGAIRSIDFQGTINSAMQKVPFLKGKGPVQIDNGFKLMSADLKFVNGTIIADPLIVNGRGRSFDMKGKSRIEESMEQDTYLDVYDPQGILPSQISQGSKAPSISLHITGLVSAPSPDYGYTVQRLATNYAKGAGKATLQNLGKSLFSKGGGGGGNAAPAPGQKPAPAPPAKAVEDALKKKFGF